MCVSRIILYAPVESRVLLRQTMEIIDNINRLLGDDLKRSAAPWSPEAIATLAAFLRLNADERGAQASLADLGPGDAYGASRGFALYHLFCGELDKAADWVEKAIAQRDLGMMFYVRLIVAKKLRASSYWPKLAKMMNLPEAT